MMGECVMMASEQDGLEQDRENARERDGSARNPPRAADPNLSGEAHPHFEPMSSAQYVVRKASMNDTL
jgi:hypothetical protein